MANFSRISDLSETFDLKPVELLRLAMELDVLVVAKIPLGDVYLVASRRELYPIIQRKPPTTTKLSSATWLVLSDFNIEQVCEYGYVDIDEFNTIAFDRDDEGIITNNSWDLAESTFINPLREKTKLPAFFEWKDSSFIITTKSSTHQDDPKRHQIRANFNSRDLFIDKKIKEALLAKTSKDDDSENKENETKIVNIKHEWMSENLYVLNNAAKKFFQIDNISPASYKNIREKVRSYLYEKLSNKGRKYSDEKIESAIDLITPDHLLNAKHRETIKNVPPEKDHTFSTASSSLKILNNMAKELWESHISGKKGYPMQSVIADSVEKDHNIIGRTAKCFASIITPDEIKNGPRKRKLSRKRQL